MSSLREELNAGVTTPLPEPEDPEKKLRITQLELDRSESQIDWLTQLPLELQEVVNKHQDAQDFEDLETASRWTVCFSEFFQSASPLSRNIFATQKMNSSLGYVFQEVALGDLGT